MSKKSLMPTRIVETKYIGATNHKPGRIKARFVGHHGKSITLSYDHGLDQLENHRLVAQALSDKNDSDDHEFHWQVDTYSGVDGGGYLFVLALVKVSK